MSRAAFVLFALVGLLAVLSLMTPSASAPPPEREPDVANTFSIAAYDPDKKEWGVAVASRYLAVGSAVPFAKAGVGCVATQASVNVTYGPKGLELMAEGKSSEEAVKALTDA